MTHPMQRGLNGTSAGACWCPSPTDLIGAALTSRTLAPSCPIHQADEIAAAAEAERIGEITAGADALEAVLDKVRHQAEARTAQASADAAAEERERRLGELDPLAGSIARAVGAPMTDNSSMALSADAGTIAAALGMQSAD